MPNLPKPRLRRPRSRRGELVSQPAAPEPQTAQRRADRLQRPALGQHRVARLAGADLARGALRVPRARPRGRALAQPAAEDRRLRRLPLHRPPPAGLRPPGGPPRHRRARPLRRPRLRGDDPEPAAAAGRVPVRALPDQRGAARTALLARLRLPPLPARRRQLRLLLPDAAQDRQQARRARGPDLRRAGRGGRPRHLQRQAGDHQLPQSDPAAAARSCANSSG